VIILVRGRAESWAGRAKSERVESQEVGASSEGTCGVGGESRSKREPRRLTAWQEGVVYTLLRPEAHGIVRKRGVYE
jgi:hypothetical protein